MRRLWAKVEIGDPEECWPFTGYLLKGYGRIGLGGRRDGVAYAHRVVAEDSLGPCPDGQSARHLCGNRACCNPRHLAWGSQSENERDKLRHGLSNRGERHGMARLSQDDVLAIRARCASGEYQRIVADDYGIRQQHVSEIVNRRVWQWLP